MYKYKKRFINSTKSSTIFDSNGNKIRVIRKYYKSIFEKIIRTITFGGCLERYLLSDDKDNIIVKSNKISLSQKICTYLF